jgi:hypothetical protein
VRKSLDIAADICVYTNRNVTIETLKGADDMASVLSVPADVSARPVHGASMAGSTALAHRLRQWWGEPETQFALVSEDLDHPAMDQFIVVARQSPVRLFAMLRSDGMAEKWFWRAAGRHARH